MSAAIAILAGTLLAGEVSQRPAYSYVDDHYELAADIGGDVRAYAAHFADIQKQGAPIRVMGDCLSACTMVLRNRLACAMPGARFGFHLAKTYNKQTREILGISDYGNQTVWSHYPIHVRTRLGTLTENMVNVRGTDFLPPCKPAASVSAQQRARARRDVEAAARFTR
jgi:hypothetical protein